MMIKENPRFTFVLLIIIVCCLTGCSSSTEITTIAPIESPNTPVSDTVAIYCQIMPTFGDEKPLILLQDKTELRLSSGDSIDKDMNFARHGLTDGRDETIFQDFKNKNRGTEPLVEQIACDGANVQIIKSENSQRFSRMPMVGGVFKKNYPDTQ